LLQWRGFSRVKVCVRSPASISPAALERRSLPDERPVAIVVEAPFRELCSGQPRLLDFGWEAIRPRHPNTPHGVPKVDDRSARNGILCWLGSGAPCAARQGPQRRCAQTCGINRWRKAAVRKRPMEEAPGASNWGSARTFGVEPTVKIGRKTARSRSPPPGVAGFPQAGRARIFSRAAGAHATLKRLADR
jgi:hypothetical protein